MISLHDIEQEISLLEQKETSYSNCERLAMLYIVRDRLKNKTDGIGDSYRTKQPENPPTKLESSQIVKLPDSSDFFKAINGKNIESVWKIMDELMTDTLRIIQPRLYDSVIQKLKSI